MDYAGIDAVVFMPVDAALLAAVNRFGNGLLAQGVEQALIYAIP